MFSPKKNQQRCEPRRLACLMESTVSGLDPGARALWGHYGRQVLLHSPHQRDAHHQTHRYDRLEFCQSSNAIDVASFASLPKGLPYLGSSTDVCNGVERHQISKLHKRLLPAAGCALARLGSLEKAT